MRGARRAAVLGAIAVASAACEALIGITDREVTVLPDGGTETGAGNVPEVGSTEEGEAATSATGETGADTNGLPAGEAGPDGTRAAEGGEASAAGDSGSADTTADGMSTADGETDSPHDAGDGSSADAGVRDPDVPCTMQPTFVFCEDFDNEPTVGSDFDYYYTQGDGGVAQFDSTQYRSAPYSAQIIAPPAVGQVAEVQMGKTPQPLATGVRLAFDLRVDLTTYNNLPQVAVEQLYLKKGESDQAQINFVLNPGAQGQLQAYDVDGGSNVNAAAPPLQTWVRIAIGYDSTTGIVSVYQDGLLLGSTGIGAGPAGTVTLIAGAPYVNSNGTATPVFELDNIVLSAQ